MASARGHRWGKYVFLPWSVCFKCGLVALKNERSRAAVKAKCSGDE